MFKKNFSWCVFLLFFFTAAVRADEFALLKTERIGEFSSGLSEKVLKKKLHCAFKRDVDTLWGADGLYHQTWGCPAVGISFGMSSEWKGGSKTIESITITAPSKLKTKRGIQIGSSEQQVIKAYHDVKDVEDSVPKESFVAGSVYGGLFFEFQNGKVSSIMLGAGAE